MIVYVYRLFFLTSFVYLDYSKAKKDLKWKPKVSFEKGVSKILENIDYWRDAPLWNKNNIKQTTKLWFKYLK